MAILEPCLNSGKKEWAKQLFKNDNSRIFALVISLIFSSFSRLNRAILA
jgi:hypothetical protein